MVDIVFVNPGDRKQIYQNLGADVSAIEPPFLTASFASYLRSKGFSVAIVDAQAENMAPSECAERVKELNPLSLISGREVFSLKMIPKYLRKSASQEAVTGLIRK